MAQNPIQRHRRNVRGFVAIWAGITFIMASATFVAVYMAYGSLASPDAPLADVAIPRGTENSAAIAALSTLTATRPPTATLGVTAVADSGATAQPTIPPTINAQAAPIEPSAMPPTATLLPVDDRRFHLGTQVELSYDRMGEWMNVAANQLHVNWIKGQVRWEDVEPQNGEYDWTIPDIYIPAAADPNVELRLLVSIVTAPDWAREPGVNLDQHGPPADPAEYAQFVTDLLERYPGQIHAVEVWNEMNLDREWTSSEGLTAANYVELLRVTYQAIKEVDPGIIVVSGALAPTGLSDGVAAWDDFVYMDQLIEAGMLNYADCVGAHHNGINLSPEYQYDNAPNDPTAAFRGPFDNPHHSWSFRSTLETYAYKIELAGGDQQLCVTEFGWPSAEGLEGVRAGFEFARDNTLEEQRDWTVIAIDFMLEEDFVWLAFLWNLNYGPQAGWSVDNDNVPYSIIGPGTVFRPVFDAVRDWNLAYEADLAAGT